MKRFWSKVRKTHGCWIWMAALSPRGYGLFRHPERIAHRVSWELHHGPIPYGRWVLHHCDNPRCVRPDHLYLGDYIDNGRDKAERGRVKGSNNPKARLNAQQVRYIRRHADRPYRELADRFGVHPAHICRIIKRRVWRWLH